LAAFIGLRKQGVVGAELDLAVDDGRLVDGQSQVVCQDSKAGSIDSKLAPVPCVS